ncbi:MAG: DUF814 domain-containing protein [Cytophagales bacterium]|nr:MAG: DUF814 domain-containing protein [Cytophagales bacterium]
MHNNSFLIAQLAEELSDVLKNAQLIECFSQNKEELILIFQQTNDNVFYIQAHLTAQFSIVSFPKEFKRAKNNSITLYPELSRAKVCAIYAIKNERAFVIELSNQYKIFFKLFGNRANVLIVQSNTIVKVFKKSLAQDWNIDILNSNKTLEFQESDFYDSDFDLKSTFYTLGKVGFDYLISIGFQEKTPHEQYQQIVSLISYLNKPQFYIAKYQDNVILSLLEIGVIISKHDSVIDALSNFYLAHFKYNHFNKIKNDLLLESKRTILREEKNVLQMSDKLNELVLQRPFSEIADIIMANLNQISLGIESIDLFDFYHNTMIRISLDTKLSPQNYANYLYKKSKTKTINIERLQQQLTSKKTLIHELIANHEKILSADNYKELDAFLNERNKQSQSEKIVSPYPKFNHFEYMGFTILVGRNAKNNDLLTQQFAHKDDLWLHAKDVAGSHVVVKFKSGNPFPKPVVEYAASLAAFFSKRKNENLCPVTYTLKKYVRKVKGAAAGAVKIEREEVVMVKPLNL